MKLNSNIVKINKDIIYRLGNKTVLIINIKIMEVYNLENLAFYIWKLLDKENNIEKIINIGSNKGLKKKEIIQKLNELRKLKLINFRINI